MIALSFLRLIVLLNGAVPMIVLLWDAYHGHLGANSVNYALHVSGILSLVFLMLSLLVSPMRWLTGWGGWIAFRRTLGLYGFFYSVVHVVIYVGFDRALDLSSTLDEIWKRRFLQVGAAAIFLMVPLAVTSTNAMIKNIGAVRWKRLHKLAYLVAILGVVHYYMLVKSDTRQPIAFAVVLGVLLAARFVKHYLELKQAANVGRVAGTRFATSSRIDREFTNATPESGTQNNPSRTRRVMMAPEESSGMRKTEPGSRQAGTSRRKPWSGELLVDAVVQETHDVKTFRLVAMDHGPLPFEFLPGQYLNLQFIIQGKRVNRSYTIASSPTKRHSCELTTKRHSHGAVSLHMHDEVHKGSKIRVTAPAGKFIFTGEKASGVLLIAGGVGITPLMSIVRDLTDRNWTGEIYFVVNVKTEKDIIFRDELMMLELRHQNLHVCVVLSRADSGGMWQGECGRVTGELLRRRVPRLADIPAFVCGPDAMMDATVDLLLELGVPRDQINTEAFVSPGIASAKNGLDEVSGLLHSESFESESNQEIPGAILAGSKSISFARSNITTEVESGLSLLEASEDCSVNLPFDCRSGICGQCKTKLLQGHVAMECQDALSRKELADGWILACQARPTTDIVVDA